MLNSHGLPLLQLFERPCVAVELDLHLLAAGSRFVMDLLNRDVKAGGVDRVQLGAFRKDRAAELRKNQLEIGDHHLVGIHPPDETDRANALHHNQVGAALNNVNGFAKAITQGIDRFFQTFVIQCNLQ